MLNNINFPIPGPDLPRPMLNHCMTMLSNDLIVIDSNLDSFYLNFSQSKWRQINSEFPCDNVNQTRMTCNAFDDRFVIVPSVDKGASCTAIYDIKTDIWTRLENDIRDAPYDGFLQYLPNGLQEQILLYIGGKF